jgi:trehalose utilization protein
MSKEEFKVGDIIRCISGWYTGEETNRFTITYNRGKSHSEFYPRYDIENYTTGESFEGCYLHNGEWGIIKLNQNKDE